MRQTAASEIGKYKYLVQFAGLNAQRENAAKFFGGSRTSGQLICHYSVFIYFTYSIIY